MSTPYNSKFIAPDFVTIRTGGPDDVVIEGSLYKDTITIKIGDRSVVCSGLQIATAIATVVRESGIVVMPKSVGK